MYCKLLQTFSFFSFYIEMISRNPLKFQHFLFWTQFLLTNTRRLIYIFIHYKLKKSKLISNIDFDNRN